MSGTVTDNLFRASGLVQAVAAGRTGTVDWCTTAKTSPFTAATATGYFVNTCGGAITVTLPASPSAGDIVSVADYASTWSTNNVTLGRNSSKINAGCNDATLSSKGQSITMVYVDGTRGWKSAQGSTCNVTGVPGFVCASGGNATITCGDYNTHIFTGPGTFTVSSVSPTAPDNIADYLVVAGGASGGSGRGGGGGAGGFRTFQSTPATSPLSAPAGLTLSAQAYPITVGAGGAARASSPAQVGASGGNSIFDSITSAGGGGGGASPNTPGSVAGSGGSGGGGNFHLSPTAGGAGNTPPVSPAQGFVGSAGGPADDPCANRGAGAGGGAAATGGASPRGAGGVGSYVVDAFIGPPSAPSYGTSGPVSSTRYFAGGGGAGQQASPGGPAPPGGGGGAGNGTSSATDGTTNTGGGGGGVGESACTVSGAGGSGVVMIRYKFQ